MSPLYSRTYLEDPTQAPGADIQLLAEVEGDRDAREGGDPRTKGDGISTSVIGTAEVPAIPGFPVFSDLLTTTAPKQKQMGGTHNDTIVSEPPLKNR